MTPRALILALALLATPAGAQPLPLNPEATQATIGATICVPGWTRTIRPKSSVMRKIKRAAMAALAEPWRDRRAYELDHKIPLSLGGAPIARENLALQPIKQAHEKNAVETCLNWTVCHGQMTLDEAQTAIWTNCRQSAPCILPRAEESK